MTREIKFRAWVPKDYGRHSKGMYVGVEHAYDTLGSMLDSDGKSVDYFWQSFGDVIADEAAGELHLMQYTGLKDKNGKEIYEGDVVTCGSKRKCPHVIEWRSEVPSSGFGGMPGFYLSGLNEGYVWIGEHPDGEEVIGNIYENPELIEKP